MQRRSITFLNRVYPPSHGATGRILRDLARSFARDGWNVTIITSGAKAARERDGAIRVIRVKGAQKPAGIMSYLKILMKMTFAALRQPPADLVVTMTDPPLAVIAGNIIRKAQKAKHIHWCQDMYPDLLPVFGNPPAEFLMARAKAMMHKALIQCDKIIVIGRCMARRLTKSGVPASQITFIPNWPNLELVSTIQPAAKKMKIPAFYLKGQVKRPEDQLKTSPKFRILYAGTLGLAHPIATILEAAAILNQTDPQIEFTFVGEGARYDELAAERSRLHLDNIRLLPYQPANRLRELMESGDMHLISMDKAAAGMLVPSKLYSAIAVQRPCIFIGPKSCEAAKVIKDFGAGIVINQGKSQELVEHIQAYVSDSNLWYAAHEGAKEASQIYTPKESIEAWIARAKTIVESN